jgi:hypothetical protein
VLLISHIAFRQLTVVFGRRIENAGGAASYRRIGCVAGAVAPDNRAHSELPTLKRGAQQVPLAHTLFANRAEGRERMPRSRAWMGGGGYSVRGGSRTPAFIETCVTLASFRTSASAAG